MNSLSNKLSTINHKLILVGTNHKYSPIGIRERLSFSKKKLKEALISLVGYGGIKAAVILSTCNRVELYADSLDSEAGIMSLKEFLSEYHHQELIKIEPYLYTYINKEAIRHLFSVSCGIDSQIIGETQILEQVRFAHNQAKMVETTDRFLDTVFNKAIENSLNVRQKTKISSGKLSIGSVAIDLIKKRYAFIKDKKILIIGVGKISELVVRYLKKENVKVIFIANRTYQKAKQLADHINAEVIGFDRLKGKLKDTDVIISATASPHLILRKEDILEAFNHRPLLIIDLALPRDVEPEIKHIEGVSLFCLDDLDSILEKNLDRRRQEIPKVQKIIEEGLDNLWSKLIELEPERVGLP